MPSRPTSVSNSSSVNKLESLPDDDFINPTTLPKEVSQVKNQMIIEARGDLLKSNMV
jgi:hypothetical protein